MSLPERLGRLRRVDRLGVGGFATVWLYRDDDLASDVAVKALADNWAQRLDIRERFLEEARILRRADSDHVVRVYDIGEEEGTPYFVMTYADRGSLASIVEPGLPIAPARVVDLVCQAGEGVGVLHAQGVVHRDIKPPNLLLRSNGDHEPRLLVADLGVAKAMLHASGLTQVVGTPAYMAPEQAAGLGVDSRADIHALAAVAYQLLTGRQVRTGGFGALADATLPPAPSTLADVPTALDEVILRALQPDPAARYPEVAEFVAALRQAVPAAPPPAPGGFPATLAGPSDAIDIAPSARAEASSQPMSQPMSLALLALLFVLVLGGSFALSYAVASKVL